MKREYDGSPIDATWQDIQDRPYKGSGETVDVTPGESGRETTEGTDELFGPTPGERAKELLPAFRKLPNDELWTFLEERVEGDDVTDDERTRSTAALMVLMERSDSDIDVFAMVKKYTAGDISGGTLGEVLASALPE